MITMGSIPIGISASRGAAILGQSKYSEPVEAWLKIMEDRIPGFCEQNMYPKPEFVDNAATRWGNALEEYICDFAAIDHDQTTHILDREKFCRHEEFDFITCHIDGEYSLPTYLPYTLHEGKTANERTFRSDWGKPGTDHIPRGYMIQVQHQMALTDADQCIVSVLVIPKMQVELPESSDISKEQIYKIASGLYEMGCFHQYPVKRNQGLIDLMIERYVEFWENNVLKQIPPRPQSLEWIKKMIPKPAGTIIANEQVQRWSTELSGLQREMKAGKKRADQLKSEILGYMKEQSEMEGVCIDSESTERLILLAGNGYKMHSYNGKTFR